MAVIQNVQQAVNGVAATEAIRKHFPALNRQHNGHPVAYFDGPGGTQVPSSVVKAMMDYLYNHNANTHWNYPTSAETDQAIEHARTTLAEFLNSSPEEIAFGANMTTLTYHLSRALGRQYNAGDEVIITELDHHANIGPWQALAQERGITLRLVKMLPETGQLDWDDFVTKVNSKTKLVAIGAASNALGTVNDVRRAAVLAHSVGAQIFVDAVHFAPHILVDVQALDCDFLAVSAYKFNGPHIGVLYGRQNIMRQIDFPKLEPAPATAPERAETGTQNHEGMVGAAAAVDYLASLADGATRRERLITAFSALHKRGLNLVRQLWGGLTAIEGVKLYGPTPDLPRTSTVSFTVANFPSGEVSSRLAAKGIFVSHGDFYATTAVERLGLSGEGLVRVGCACYTTDEEVARLIEEVRYISCQ